MFTKMRAELAAERKRADEAKQIADDAKQRADEAEQQLAILRQQREEEHRLWMADARKRREEERRRADEDWRITMQQNAEMHQAMMVALTELTAAIARLGREHSGNARNGH